MLVLTTKIFSSLLMSLSNVKVTNVFQRKWPRNEWITFFPWDIKCYQMVLHKIAETLLETSHFLSTNPIFRMCLIISFANWSLVKNLDFFFTKIQLYEVLFRMRYSRLSSKWVWSILNFWTYNIQSVFFIWFISY